ncbi:MAG TPA: DUF3108 domain-containing protein, partial [Pyrinomonadaceae bacterium]|nr:DUF3108 domain-containing protein [Pyrinomonadaceae bacterium]
MMTQRLKLATARHFFFISLVLGAFGLPVFAQSTADGGAQPFSPAPYKVGEKLTYNISYANFNSAAHVELLVGARGTFFDREGIQLKGRIETTGIVNAALFSINNDYISYVDPASGLPFHSQQTVREASLTSETSAEFNRPAGALPSREISLSTGTYDVLSAIYRIRALPLGEGATYALPVTAEGNDYQVEVKVKGREVIRTNAGSFETIVAQLRIKNTSGGSDYRAFVYFSNDPRHIPVLITAKPSAGEIRAELAGSEFIPTPNPPPGKNPAEVPLAATSSSSPNPGRLDGVPFKVGEQLNYQVYLPTIAAPVARATFQVRARSKYFNQDGLLFTVNAETTNALQKLFVANDTISSYVNPQTMLPFQTELNLSEGRLRVSTKLTMNQDYGRATTEKGERIEIPVGTHDYLSFFYVVRMFDLTISKRSAISILVNNKPKTLFVTALKRENVQLGSQTIPSIQVS